MNNGVRKDENDNEPRIDKTKPDKKKKEKEIGGDREGKERRRLSRRNQELGSWELGDRIRGGRSGDIGVMDQRQERRQTWWDGILGRMMRRGGEEERNHVHNSCGMALTLRDDFSYYFIYFLLFY